MGSHQTEAAERHRLCGKCEHVSDLHWVRAAGSLKRKCHVLGCRCVDFVRERSASPPAAPN